MADTLTLDSTSIYARFRRQPAYERRPIAPVSTRFVQDVYAPPRHQPTVQAQPKPKASPPQAYMPIAASPQTARSAAAVHATKAVHSKVLARTFANHVPVIPEPQPPRRQVSLSYWQPRLLMIAAGGLCALGLWVGISGLVTNHQAAAQVQQLSHQAQQQDPGGGQTSNVTVPSETKPAGYGVAGYHVAPNMPHDIAIPKLGVDASILKLGVLANGALGTPPNIYETGWYSGSSLPGQQGAMVIDGHVHGPTQPGVFVGLKKLVPGDQITVTRGDGAKFTYKVVTSKVYNDNNVDMAALMTPITAGKPGLNLITCTGSLNSTKTEYTQRIIVFASLQ